MDILLSPHARLLADEPAPGAPDAPASPVDDTLRTAAAESSAHVLLALAGPLLQAPLAPAAAYWRDFARRLVVRLAHTPDPDPAAPIPPPDADELAGLVAQAPPMTGGEYLTPDALLALWREMDTETRARLAAHPESPAAWLQSLHPLWRLVGRVTFHLAENRRDPERPFAFLATYTHRLSESARPQYLPLAKAIQEHAGDREALARLLAPLHRAAESSPLARELVETQRVFQPQSWTARQAFRFLQEIPRMEDAGLLVRIPDLWKSGHPPRPAVTLQVGKKNPGSFSLQQVVSFDVSVTLPDGQTLSPEEIAQILETTDGLALLRGQWIEIDRDRLRAVLDHWRQAATGAYRHGVPFGEALRLAAGLPGKFSILATDTGLDNSDNPDDLLGPDRPWTRVQPGPWLEETLAGLRAAASDSDAASEPPPPGLRATLRPYQQTGVHWLRLLSSLGLGACLADDMGLGKTLQILALLLHHRHEHPDAPPSLLVVPASLLANWQAEAAKFAPDLRVLLLHPSALPSADLARVRRDPAAALAGQHLVLVTYALAARWLLREENSADVETTPLSAPASESETETELEPPSASLATFPWSHVILDEAQAIKNPAARQTRALKTLAPASPRIALSGTPIENNLGDLWSLFDFLNPGLLGPAKVFTRLTGRLGGKDGPGFGPLRQLLRPYILRRLKTDRRIIADLPDKTETKTYCTLSKTQAVLYAETLKDLSARLAELAPDENSAGASAADPVAAAETDTRRRGAVLSALLRLKQVCNHPAQWGASGDYRMEESGKFQRLAELARQIAERQEKALIFTQFRELAEPLHDLLRPIFRRPGLILHGGIPVPKRRALVEQFQRDDGPPFFILSLKAGGTGLTLTQASHVIHFDRWWNPAVENQATDRAFRIGQKKNVLVHKFVCQGTLEEKIDALLETKQALSDDLLATGPESDGAARMLTSLSTPELLRFLSLDLRRAVEE